MNYAYGEGEKKTPFSQLMWVNNYLSSREDQTELRPSVVSEKGLFWKLATDCYIIFSPLTN